MKKIITLLCVCLLCLTFSLKANAENYQYVGAEADGRVYWDRDSAYYASSESKYYFDMILIREAKGVVILYKSFYVKNSDRLNEYAGRLLRCDSDPSLVRNEDEPNEQSWPLGKNPILVTLVNQVVAYCDSK